MNSFFIYVCVISPNPKTMPSIPNLFHQFQNASYIFRNNDASQHIITIIPIPMWWTERFYHFHSNQHHRWPFSCSYRGYIDIPPWAHSRFPFEVVVGHMVHLHNTYMYYQSSIDYFMPQVYFRHSYVILSGIHLTFLWSQKKKRIRNQRMHSLVKAKPYGKASHGIKSMETDRHVFSGGILIRYCRIKARIRHKIIFSGCECYACLFCCIGSNQWAKMKHINIQARITLQILFLLCLSAIFVGFEWTKQYDNWCHWT